MMNHQDNLNWSMRQLFTLVLPNSLTKVPTDFWMVSQKISLQVHLIPQRNLLITPNQSFLWFIGNAWNLHTCTINQCPGVWPETACDTSQFKELSNAWQLTQPSLVKCHLQEVVIDERVKELWQWIELILVSDLRSWCQRCKLFKEIP